MLRAAQLPDPAAPLAGTEQYFIADRLWERLWFHLYALDGRALPREGLAALRHFHEDLGGRIFGRFGFVDGFSEQHDWYADSFVAINQGPTVVMIENHRSGFPWKLFMRIPEVQAGLSRLGFRSPHLP